jgi:hypothetical protein
LLVEAVDVPTVISPAGIGATDPDPLKMLPPTPTSPRKSKAEALGKGDYLMDLYIGIAVVIATLSGPVLAVLVTRFIDARRDRKTRQTDLFRILMRSRRANLSP